MENIPFKRMEYLVNWLNERTKEYDEGHPTVSDKEWDDAFFELVKLEECGVFLTDSPTQKVSWDTVSELSKVTHNHPMLSLAKTKDMDEFQNYFSNIAPNKDVIGMLKLDGLTCSLRYVDGHLVSAETRGNGEVGEDILHNAKINNSIPLHISYREELILDGEIICDLKKFWKYDEKNGGDYKNPRNFASGKIRSLNSADSCPTDLTFVVWNIIKGFDEENSFYKKLNKVNKLGFTITPYTTSLDWDWAEFLQDKAKKLDYPIDGLVGRFDDVSFGNNLGSTGHHVKAAYAFKFYDEEWQTSLLDIEYDVSRKGILTPVAIFNPVDTGDSVISKASLHNLSIMEKLSEGFERRGDILTVRKANMIIPEVVSWKHIGDYSEENHISIPTKCPCCDGDTEIRQDGVAKILYCSNPKCERKLTNIISFFCSKKGMDIKGLSEKTIEKLIDWGWLNSIKDLYKLKSYRKEWIKKSGFGVASVDKILAAIEGSRDFDLAKFISALGIREIGSAAAKSLANQFCAWDAFRQATREDILSLDGFGEVMCDAIINFDYTEADEIIEKYQNPFIRIVDQAYTDVVNYITNAVSKELSLLGKTFVITGKLSKSRDLIQADIEAAGGKVTGSVSSKTSYLVIDNVNSTTGKAKKAKELGVSMISEEELYKMIKGE